MNSVYLDTNFLLRFTIPHHQDSKKAKKFFAQLMVEYDEIYVSVLSFYELWDVVRKYNNFYEGDRKNLRKLNRFLRKIMKPIPVHFKVVWNKDNFSYKQLFEKLRRSTNKISKSNFIKVLSLEEQDATKALKAINKYNEKPGDSLHYSVMKKEGIKNIVTEDSGFNDMDVNDIWFGDI